MDFFIAKWTAVKKNDKKKSFFFFWVFEVFDSQNGVNKFQKNSTRVKLDLSVQNYCKMPKFSIHKHSRLLAPN